MIDREYLKFNTSIQTSSNSGGHRTDDEGNLEATIELRLPDNIFNERDGNRKIDNVSLQASKLRVSMENTPIAQIPLDVDLSAKYDVGVSTCKLGVYPYCILDNNTLEPSASSLLYNGNSLALGNYWNHLITFNFKYIYFAPAANSDKIQYAYDDTDDAYAVGKTVYETNSVITNDLASFTYWLQNFNPSTYSSSSNAFEKIISQLPGLEIPASKQGITNLVSPLSQEKVNLTNDGTSLFFYQIGSIQQILADALETAVVNASTSSHITIDVYMVDSASINVTPLPIPNYDISVVVPQQIMQQIGSSYPPYNRLCYYWKHKSSSIELTSSLRTGFKPQIKLGNDYLSISYDTAAFKDVIPVLWNPSYIQTYDLPAQLKLEDMLSQSLYRPPPKRQYLYGVSETENPAAYNYSILSNLECAPLNIIGNEELEKTFSFLPWTHLNSKVQQAIQQSEQNLGVPYTKYKITTYNVAFNTYVNDNRSGGLAPTSFDITTSLYTKKIEYSGVNSEDYPMFSSFISSNTVGNYKCVVYKYSYDKSLGDSVYTRFDQTWDLGSVTTSLHTNSSFKPAATYSASNEQECIGGAKITEPTITQISEEVVDVLPADKEIGLKCTETTNTPLTSLPEKLTCMALGDLYAAPIPFKTRNILNPTEIDYTYLYAYQLSLLIPNLSYADYQTWLADSPIHYYCSALGPIAAFQSSNRIWLSQKYIFSDTNPSNDREGVRRVYVIIPFNSYFTMYMGQFLFHSFGLQNREIGYSTSLTYEKIEPYFDETEDLPKKPLVSQLGSNFSLLDGTTCEVSVGQQEVVKVNTTKTFKQTKKYEYFKGTVKSRVLVGGAYDYSTDTYSSYELTPHEFNGFNLSFTDNIPNGNPIDTTSGGSYIVYCERYEHGTNTNPKYVYTMLGNAQTPTVSNTSLFDAWEEQVVHKGPVIRETYQDETNGYVDHITEEIISDNSINEGTTRETTVINDNFSASRTSSVQTSILGAFPKVVYGQWIGKNSQTGVVSLDKMLQFSPYCLNLATTGVSWKLPTEAENNPLAYSYLPLRPMRTADYMWVYYDEETNEDRYYAAWHSTAPAGIIVAAGIQIITSNLQNGFYDKSESKIYEVVTTTNELLVDSNNEEYVGNVRLTFTWPNLPMVVMSPIASIVLTLQGMHVTNEVLPYNIQQPEGSSLVSTLPVIENFYSLATTLRDLHDELVIIKEQFDDTATYTLKSTGGQERSIVLSVKYIAKDGSLHQLYIPPNGVFSIQLTFGISYYHV